MSGLMGTLIVILAFGVMAAISSAGGGHSGHTHTGHQAGHHQHQGGLITLMGGESSKNLHNRLNYDGCESEQ